MILLKLIKGVDIVVDFIITFAVGFVAGIYYVNNKEVIKTYIKTKFNK